MRRVFCFILLSVVLSAAQSLPKTGSVKSRRPSKIRNSQSEDTLRIRLQFNPHDAQAHKTLVDLLEKKYAFRAIVVEEANWLNSNRSDLFSLIELISYAENALHDPEYAIAQLQLHLASVKREDDPETFDDLSDQLAAKLRKRGRPDEALPIFAGLVRLNANEGGFWADYADDLCDLGRYEEATKAYRRAISLNTSMESFHEGFAETLLSSGDLAGAESEYRAALSLYYAQYNTGEPTDAFHSLVRKMVDIERKFGAQRALAETQLKLAHILLLEKKYDDAIELTQAALSADHTAFVGLYLQAQIYDAKGERDRASRVRQDASTQINKEATSENLKGGAAEIDPRVVFLQDRLWNDRFDYPALPSEVIGILEPRLARLSTVERLMLAWAYFASGRSEDGKREWESALLADPKMNTAQANFQLGQQLLKTNLAAEALPHFQRAYELDPQNTTFRLQYENSRNALKK
jgi:tetratricopeptide (TPR) repeat protein